MEISRSSAGAGWSDHEEIVAAGGRDFERALGAFLTFDVGEIGHHARGLEDLRLRPRQHLRALEVVGELDERRSRDDLDVGTCPGRFGPARRGADQSLAAGVGANGGRQDACDRSDRAVEAEFAENRKSG